MNINHLKKLSYSFFFGVALFATVCDAAAKEKVVSFIIENRSDITISMNYSIFREAHTYIDDTLTDVKPNEINTVVVPDMGDGYFPFVTVKSVAFDHLIYADASCIKTLSKTNQAHVVIEYVRGDWNLEGYFTCKFIE